MPGGHSFPPPIGNRLYAYQCNRNGGWGPRRSGLKPHRERNGISRHRCRQSVRLTPYQLAVPRSLFGRLRRCGPVFPPNLRDCVVHFRSRSFEQYDVSNDTESVSRESKVLQGPVSVETGCGETPPFGVAARGSAALLPISCSSWWFLNIIIIPNRLSVLRSSDRPGTRPGQSGANRMGLLTSHTSTPLCTAVLVGCCLGASEQIVAREGRDDP